MRIFTKNKMLFTVYECVKKKYYDIKCGRNFLFGKEDGGGYENKFQVKRNITHFFF